MHAEIEEEAPTVDIFFENRNLQIYLEKVVESREAQMRLQNGEVFVDAIPNAFNLGQCYAPTDVGTKEIFDFIRTYAQEHSSCFGSASASLPPCSSRAASSGTRGGLPRSARVSWIGSTRLSRTLASIGQY